MIHPKTPKNYAGSFEDLAKELGDLRYDSLAAFFELLSQKIQQDGEKDQSRGRAKLAQHLFQSADMLKKSAEEMDKAWVICKPFMETYEP
jgi:hypothetical protein